MPIGLIGVAGRAHVLHRHVRATGPADAPRAERARNLLVRVRRLLDAPFPAVVVAPRTAAHAEEPEQSGAAGEGHGHPGDRVHAPAERGLDSVWLERAIEDASHCRVDARRHAGGDEREESADLQRGPCQSGSHEQAVVPGPGRTHPRDDGGDETAPAAEDGKEANDQLEHGGDEGGDVDDEHPLGYDAVDVDAVAQSLGDGILGGAVVQAPHLDGVEVELRLGFAAVLNARLVFVRERAGTVVPQRDGIERLQVVHDVQILEQLADDIIIDLGAFEDALVWDGIEVSCVQLAEEQKVRTWALTSPIPESKTDLHEPQIIRHTHPLVRATDSQKHQTYYRPNGQGYRSDYACQSAGFAHLG